MESVGSYKGADEVYMSGLEATELRLGLPGTPPTSAVLKAKRALEEDNEPTVDQIPQQQESSESASPPAPPPAKAQVVGWPPVQSFRRRNNGVHQQQQANKKASPPEEKQVASSAAAPAASNLLVKVSMDGAPYLRKVDLGSYNGYKDLRLAIDAMFRCFSPLSLQYMMTYEDKDGDWMLVGDVPWEMFASSCKRLRIMKSTTEA